MTFNNYSDLQNYVYNLYFNLTNNRQFLCKKLEKSIDKNLLDFYNNNVKLIQYNEKFLFVMAKKRLLLERKNIKKQYDEYKKSFNIELKKKLPYVNVILKENKVLLSSGKLPKLFFKSDIEGSISWDIHQLKPGINEYTWIFKPQDTNKYTTLKGVEKIFVIDDTKNITTKQTFI